MPTTRGAASGPPEPGRQKDRIGAQAKLSMVKFEAGAAARRLSRKMWPLSGSGESVKGASMAGPLADRGSLLRWWRTELTQLGLDAVARAVDRSPTTVHNWETGRTEGPSIDQLEEIDTRYKAGRALQGLYAAIRTPHALEAAAHWWMNFQGPSGPCWAWLRVDGEQSTTARVEAGPFALDVQVPPGSGVFVQAYAFTDNPPVHVVMRHAGWVDFGYGLVPPQIGVVVVDAAAGAVIGSRPLPDPALKMATGLWLPGKFGDGGRWFEELKRRLGHRVESTRQALLAAVKGPVGTGSDLRRSHASRASVPQRWDGPRYEALRQARGLSLSDLAKASTILDERLPPVSRDHIHRLEHGATPRLPQLPERLDMALGADGRTCTIEVPSRRVGATTIEIDFPSYWIGPVWVQFLASKDTGTDTGTDTEAPATDPPGSPSETGTRGKLIWSPWHKSLWLRDGVVVTTRRHAKNQKALRVVSPPGWSVVAGVGAHPRAVDVNEGWGLVSNEAAFAALRHYYTVLEQALRHTKPNAS